MQYFYKMKKKQSSYDSLNESNFVFEKPTIHLLSFKPLKLSFCLLCSPIDSHINSLTIIGLQVKTRSQLQLIRHVCVEDENEQQHLIHFNLTFRFFFDFLSHGILLCYPAHNKLYG